MKVASLFSGAGALDLGLHQVRGRGSPCPAHTPPTAADAAFRDGPTKFMCAYVSLINAGGT